MSWGYMGKVPGRGDFIAHNVGPEIRDHWFEWCQSVLAVSREQLGDAWMEAYLTAPIWHYAARPGVLAEAGLVGTMIPSVDRVGRHFPFLVMHDFQGSAVEAWRDDQWASSMESLVLAVLDDDWSESRWQMQVDEVAPPQTEAARVQWSREASSVMVPAATEESDWLRSMLDQGPGAAMWWTRGSAYVEPVILFTDGLPSVGQFASMLRGDWEQHGWYRAATEDS